MKNYRLEFILSENGELKVNGENEGFTPLEILGLLSWKQKDIEAQMFDGIKPDVVSRKVVKD
jgi:hypothetical protein